MLQMLYWLKILCLILNKRLQDHINEKQLINKGQIGFVPKCRTTDHLLTLKTLINKHVRDTNGKQVFACFIDFKKAYDSIWHNGLFYKLNNMEINGPSCTSFKIFIQNQNVQLKLIIAVHQLLHM